MPLKKRDGSISLPYLTQSKNFQPVVLESFNLHLSLEHFKFAPSPFKSWELVQTFQGNMTFPLTGSSNHSMPSVTHPIPDPSYSSRLRVTFNQPFTPYQHPPPPAHWQPSATRSFTLRQTPAPLQLSHVPQPDAPLNTSNTVSAPGTSNTQQAFACNAPQSLILNPTDEYFDDEMHHNYNSNNYDNEATLDSLCYFAWFTASNKNYG